MTGNFIDRLVIFIIHRIDALFFAVCGARLEHTGNGEQRAQTAANICVIRYVFRDNIHSSVYRVFSCFNALFGIYIVRRKLCRRSGVESLSKNRVGEGLKPFFFGYRSACSALGSERAVNILNFRESRSLFESGFDFGSHLLLRGYRCTDLFPALVEVAQIFELLGELTQYLIVKCAVRFFSVSGNKRYRVALVDKFHCVFDLPALETEHFCQAVYNVHKGILLLFHSFYLSYIFSAEIERDIIAYYS